MTITCLESHCFFPLVCPPDWDDGLTLGEKIYLSARRASTSGQEVDVRLPLLFIGPTCCWWPTFFLFSQWQLEFVSPSLGPPAGLQTHSMLSWGLLSSSESHHVVCPAIKAARVFCKATTVTEVVMMLVLPSIASGALEELAASEPETLPLHLIGRTGPKSASFCPPPSQVEPLKRGLHSRGRDI